MRVEISYQSLHARDSGESTAEPYLWPLFFRVDEAVYASVIQEKLDAGDLTPADLQARGLSPARLPAIDGDWLAAPGGAHGNIPPMKSGQTEQLDVSWATDLVTGHGVLEDGHAVVGCVAILWEEDLYPGHGKVKEAYTAFASATKDRLRLAVRQSIEAQAGGTGPYTFGLKGPQFGARLNQRAAADVDYVGLDRGRPAPELMRLGRLPHATLEPPALERELTRRYRERWAMPLMDCDDFVGAMFWGATVGELAGSGTQTFPKLWTPTTGSQEGTWELKVEVRVG